MVIQGLPTYAEDQLVEELHKLGFAGAVVTRLRSASTDSDNNPLFLVRLLTGTDISRFRKIKYLLQCVVTIKKFMPRNSTGTQCFRCQQFGHSARNCNMPARCVKCTESHATSDCPKTDRKEPARCCNCREDHPANYRHCSARIAYLQKLHQRKELRRSPQPQAPLPKSIPTGKPVTGPLKSWANIAALRNPRSAVQANSCEPGPSTTTIQNLTETDQATKEMLDIFIAVRKLKDQFRSCDSMFDKVLLVLTHLAQYV